MREIKFFNKGISLKSDKRRITTSIHTENVRQMPFLHFLLSILLNVQALGLMSALRAFFMTTVNSNFPVKSILLFGG